MGFLSSKRLIVVLALFASVASYESFESSESCADDTQMPLTAPAPSTPNYHLVGWLNTILPGGGQLLLGDYPVAIAQATLEASTFGFGYSLSRLHPLTIDGVPEGLPSFRIRRPNSQSDLSKELYADYLQEFGLKYHFVNVFDAYREAALRRGVTERIDQTPMNELFVKPFSLDVLKDPFVYIPIAAVAAYTMIDYYSARSPSNLQRNGRLTPYSNFLYAMNYGFVQPFGSGVPEEVFFRGFVQNEIYDAVPSPWLAIPATATLFAFAHAPGDGRLTAAISGLYLGYLADHYGGNLAPGITVHFWGVVLLGIETILLNNEAQQSTPPASFYVQINY
jgi:hypothetical protein